MSVETGNQSQENPIARRFLMSGTYIPRLERGETLFLKGSPNDNMYYVASGRLALRRKVRTLQKELKDRIFTEAIAGPGDIIGWNALALHQTPHATTAIAELPSHAISLPVDEITFWLQRHLDVAQEFGKLLEREMQKVEDHKRVIIGGKMEQKAAYALLAYNSFTDNEGAIDGTQKEIAQMAGITEITLTQDVLPVFHDKGIIERNPTERLRRGQNIIITDTERLKNLASLNAFL